MRTPIDLAGQALDAVQHPRTTASRAVEAAEALGEVAWAGLNPAPGPRSTWRSARTAASIG